MRGLFRRNGALFALCLLLLASLTMTQKTAFAQTTSGSITLSPSSGPAGTPITAIGKGFPAGDTVSIKWLPTNTFLHTTPSFITVNRSGNFSARFTIPADAQQKTTATIEFRIEDRHPPLIIDKRFSVTPTQISISTNRQKMFVFLQGIDTELTTDEINNSKNGDFGVFNKTLETILGVRSFVNSHAIFYSYANSDFFGNPTPYACVSTFTQPIKTDTILLGRQIVAALTHNPAFKGKPTDVYLIGHSLGGVVAFSYLTALYKTTGVVPPLPAGDTLKSVITFDSPIGGVSDSAGYFDLAAKIFRNFPRRIAPFQGPCGVPKDKLTSVRNLEEIFKTTSKPTFPHTDDGNPGSQGAHASILKAIFGGPAETNQGVAQDAFTHGTSILTIGNTRDFVWNPKACHVDGNFIGTQWIGDEGPTDAAKEHHTPLKTYGRDFMAGIPNCQIAALLFAANHSTVFVNMNVQEGLRQFLPNGREPTALKIAPPEP